MLPSHNQDTLQGQFFYMVTSFGPEFWPS